MNGVPDLSKFQNLFTLRPRKRTSDYKPKISDESSILANNKTLVLWLFAAVVFAFYQMSDVSLLCAIMFFLNALARLWSQNAIKSLSLTVESTHKGIFAGNNGSLSFTVVNDKFLPVIWLSFSILLPRDDILSPGPSLEIISKENPDYSNTVFTAINKQFFLLRSYQTLTWSGQWQAARRGVLHVNEIELSAGDCFGLAKKTQPYTLPQSFTLAIYPKLIPVVVSPFLKTYWNNLTGEKGYIEDVSVINSTREYHPGDNWKHINWRMLARQQPLTVNIYNKMLPKLAHFIFDGESFRGRPEEMEETLSILCSLIVRLNESGVPCGLSLPASQKMKPLNIFAAESDVLSLHQLLFALADYELKPPPADPAVSPEPSRFAVMPIITQAEEDRIGQIYFISFSEDYSEGGAFLVHIEPELVILIPYQSKYTDSFKQFSILPLDNLRA